MTVKNTIRYKFLVTLTNVKENDRGLSPELAINKVLTKGRGKVLITKEEHVSGSDFHYHIYYSSDKGLSKNTYKKRFDSLFISFARVNCIRREGVKSSKNTLNYITKKVRVVSIARFMLGKGRGPKSTFVTNITIAQLAREIKGRERFNDIMTIVEMSKFKSIEE